MLDKCMIILGIETSCDDTAAAVVTSNREIKSNIVRTQSTEHLPFGGVVPEIAARAHIEVLDQLVKTALDQANVTFKDLDGIAVTGGPGLIGGVIVGVMMAKAIAAVHNLPFLGINHLAGHALTARLTEDLEFPYLLLLVSGGHCQILIVYGANHFQLLGTTIDDAVGEAFDKIGKLLGFSYPAGPQIESLAKEGNPERFKFPRPLLGRAKQASPYAFSFSGLKTAVRTCIQEHTSLTYKDKADICASFQAAVGDVLSDRCHNALKWCEDKKLPIQSLVIAGGVAANEYLRKHLTLIANQHSVKLVAPPLSLCTDNAAMIAWAGIERIKLGLCDGLDFAPRPRWPLEEI
jgi:N6-L-threonylcarbamoyladenine synthase